MRLRVLSYNIHRAIGVDRRFRPERIVEILDHHDPDVILLQEVDDGAPRSRELDLAREIAEGLGVSHYKVGHNVTLRRGRYGNATLSRFPIIADRNIDLTIEGRKRRGCQHTTLLIDEGGREPVEIEVFNLHLGLSAREREQQVGLLICSPEFARIPHDQACLVGGDFNDWRSKLLPLFTETLDFDCATRTGRRRRSLRTYPSFSPTGGLDRIFHRGPIDPVAARTCRLQASKVASDHLPVIVDFRLLPAGRGS